MTPKLPILFQMQDLHLKYIAFTKNRHALTEQQLLMKKLFVYVARTTNMTTTTINSTRELNSVNYSFKVLFHIRTPTVFVPEVKEFRNTKKKNPSNLLTLLKQCLYTETLLIGLFLNIKILYITYEDQISFGQSTYNISNM